MNKKGNKQARGGKRTRKDRNSFQDFLKLLEKNYGGYHVSNSRNLCQLVAVYSNMIPPRMPTPGGPSPGAMFTTTQYVRGSDMTLPTGGAIVGALLRQSTSSDVFASFAFALADIGNISGLGSLFDQYRIERIQFRLRSRNPALITYDRAPPNYAACSPLVVIDRDDNTAPSTLDELRQYDNCLQMSASDSIDIVFEPSLTPSVFSGGAFSGYSVDDSGRYWLDVANTGIPHYGIKVGLPALVASTTSRFDWDVEAWYKVSFLNVR